MRAAIVAARERLGIGPGIPVADLHGNLQRQLSEADLVLNAAKAEHVRLVERVAEQSSEVAKVSTRITDFKNEMTAVKSQIARLEADWKRTAIAGEPSTAALQGAIADLERQRAETTARLGVFRRLIAGLHEWLATANLDELSQALDAVAGGTGDEAWSQHTRRLESEVEAAKSASASIQHVRDAVHKMSDEAQKKKGTMRDELNTRLGPIFARFVRSLVVDPHIAKAIESFHEQSRKTHVRVTLEDGTTPLAAHASEGQLAGVGLAMQLSMALAFPWSRWPAVLLDDPSQFSDVVHASNLVETLRLMARQFGFQIFVSTHERDFARYVQRKFANDGLAATRVLFQPPRDSKSGIIPRVVSTT
jgi:predicted  nucleic acid-binding Zn-ribbon protein